MPNQENIDRPVTLAAHGRSGTTVLAKVFEYHPDFAYVGETANLIFNAWSAVEFSAGSLMHTDETDRMVSDDERAARVVRQAVVSCLPDTRPSWFQKPIGVPTVVPKKFGNDRWPEAAEWYWKVMGRSFPRAKFFTVLRNPCDVVLSSKSYWGYGEADMWWSLGFLSYILVHQSSPIRYAILFDDLV